MLARYITYDAFGNTAAETDVAISHLFGYTGREFDKGTGLQYNRERYYDPKSGRFISQDPMSFGAGDANLYRYVSNGSTIATDPSGLVSNNPDSGKLILDPRDPVRSLNSIVRLVSGVFTRTHSDHAPPPPNILGIPTPEVKERWANTTDVDGPLLVPIRNKLDQLQDNHDRVADNIHSTMQELSLDQRERTIILFLVADGFGAREFDDAFHHHDSVDAHEQSFLERLSDGISGSSQIVINGNLIKVPFSSWASSSQYASKSSSVSMALFEGSDDAIVKAFDSFASLENLQASARRLSAERSLRLPLAVNGEGIPVTPDVLNVIGYHGVQEIGSFATFEEAIVAGQRIYAEGLSAGFPGTNNLALHQVGVPLSNFRGTSQIIGSLNPTIGSGLTPASHVGQGGIVAKVNGPSGWIVDRHATTPLGTTVMKAENEIAILREVAPEHIEELLWINSGATGKTRWKTIPRK